jgi:hypothetical protein
MEQEPMSRPMEHVALPESAGDYVAELVGDDGSLSRELEKLDAHWDFWGLLPPDFPAASVTNFRSGGLFGVPAVRDEFERVEDEHAEAELVRFLKGLAVRQPGWLISESLWRNAGDFSDRDREDDGYIVEPTIYFPVESERLIADAAFSPSSLIPMMYGFFAYVPVLAGEALELTDIQQMAQHATHRIVTAYDFESYIICERRE